MTVLTESYDPQTWAAAVDPDLGAYLFVFPNIGVESMEIWEIDTAGERTLVSASDYTLTFTGSLPLYTGGGFVMTRVHPAGTEFVSIERNTPITQLVDIQPYSRFPPQVLEFGLDKLTLIAQEIESRKCDCRETPELT
jgi:hypothetical protein